MKPKKTKQSLALLAYDSIMRKIISLEYKPSQHLEESQLVEDLEIGRTPVREALVRLQGERMVESHPKRGVIVRPITIQNIKAMFEGMEVLELGIAELAMTKETSSILDEMERANDFLVLAQNGNDSFELTESNHQFHMSFAKCAQNEFLLRAVMEVRNEAKRLSFLSYDNVIDPKFPSDKHFCSVIDEHKKIISCLKEKNIGLLKQTLKEHIQTFRERIIQFMVS